jgi:hypothetical protein
VNLERKDIILFSGIAFILIAVLFIFISPKNVDPEKHDAQLEILKSTQELLIQNQVFLSEAMKMNKSLVDQLMQRDSMYLQAINQNNDKIKSIEYRRNNPVDYSGYHSADISRYFAGLE